MEAIRGGGDDGDIGSKSEVWGSRFVKWEDLASKVQADRRLSPKLFFLEAATTKKGEEQKARSSWLQATAQGLRQNAKGTKEKYLELMQKSNGCVNSQSIFTFERNRMQLFAPTSLPLTLPNYVAC
ncbi:hypothetical protein NC653_015061 [Populus alba x Populus x berolinensis]|uniref:Uncharacterized protein n=1 Tax=Populus alba x Populus x berolinensis TaxID=444605 RepID=A0AAD6W558_9ROSI|nr:hypothetical protein NC653_015061 [Populus alba x Populus x berolinensis]